MSKVAFVLCHSSSELHGEIREGLVACQLALHGHKVKLFRLYVGDRILNRRYFEGLVPASYFPADNPHDRVHDHVSEDLLQKLDEFNPDVVVFKGIDYKVVDSVIARRDHDSRYVLTIGGTVVAPCVKRASFIFLEHQDQRKEIVEYIGMDIRTEVLAKYVDWETIEEIETKKAKKEFDIINVGYFDIRKNQIALAPLFNDYKVAFVGRGEELENVLGMAKGRCNVSFLGPMKNAATLGAIAQAKIMVHTSHFEGLPRVIGEALSLGVPFFGYSHAIRARFPSESGVFLLPVDQLFPAVKELLSNPDYLESVSRYARRFAEMHYGRKALSDAAEQIARIAGE